MKVCVCGPKLRRERERKEADPSCFNRPLNVTHITKDTKLSPTEKNLCPTHNYLCEIK